MLYGDDEEINFLLNGMLKIWEHVHPINQKPTERTCDVKTCHLVNEIILSTLYNFIYLFTPSQPNPKKFKYDIQLLSE